MFINIQETPNPSTIKFLPGVEILAPGESALFRTVDDCKTSKLAKNLIELDGVDSVFFGNDFISVTKSAAMAWPSLKPIVVATIVDHLSAGLRAVERYKNEAVDISHLTLDEQEIARQIIEIIDEKIKPAVMQDGGDIKFHSYKDGVVYVEMQGACTGCPSAAITLKDGIENMLQYYVPEVIRVEQI